MDHAAALQEMLTADPISDLTDTTTTHHRRFSLPTSSTSPTDLTATAAIHMNVNLNHHLHHHQQNHHNNNTPSGTTAATSSGNYRRSSDTATSILENESLNSLINGMAPEPLERWNSLVTSSTTTAPTSSGDNNHTHSNRHGLNNRTSFIMTNNNPMHSTNQYELLSHVPPPPHNPSQSTTRSMTTDNNHHHSTISDRLNITSLWDILNAAPSDPSSIYPTTTNNTSTSRTLPSALDRNFETDSLWRASRLEDANGGFDDEDDISVTSPLFDTASSATANATTGSISFRPTVPRGRRLRSSMGGTTSSVETDAAVNHESGGIGGALVMEREYSLSSPISDVIQEGHSQNQREVVEEERRNVEGEEADSKPPASIFVNVNNNSNNSRNGNGGNRSRSGNSNPPPPSHRMMRRSVYRQLRDSAINAATTTTTTTTTTSSPDPTPSSRIQTLRSATRSSGFSNTSNSTSRARNGNSRTSASSNTATRNSSTSRPNTRAYRKRNRNEISIPSSKKAKSTPDSNSVKTEPSTTNNNNNATTTPSSKKSCKSNTEPTKTPKKEEPNEDSKCCICLDVPTSFELAKIDGCSHLYCFSCIEEWAKRENTCPQCKTRFTEIKRVHKVKTGKRKRGTKGGKDSCNVKKVKDRDQRSDYRQQNHLQNIVGTFKQTEGQISLLIRLFCGSYISLVPIHLISSFLANLEFHYTHQNSSYGSQRTWP